MKTKPIAILLVIVCTLLTATGSLFLKMSVENFVFSVMGIMTNFYLIFGLFAFGMGFMLLAFALKNGELSVLYPIIALTYVWTLFFSAFILHEHVAYPEVIGVVFILLGVSAIGKGSTIKKKIGVRG